MIARTMVPERGQRRGLGGGRSGRLGGVSRGRVFTSLWMVYTRLPFIALVLRVLPYLPPSHLSRGPFLLVPLCDRNHGLYHQQR